ncbi:ABC transporter permease [Streptomyces sp. NBC_01808]|uniref:ABC transporter permease n=1 Tax=Streptomyces sp. NBC_01808 TaxID=2975947 RepID=UPI002DD94924|nr:ABC transporter permease [Streptomyces sp. NBC_01808]WSA36893.1 ABC transporter permease [Streptomyces sp. NBC_01808]
MSDTLAEGTTDHEVVLRQRRAAATQARRLKTLDSIFELRAFIALGVLIVVFSLLSDSFLTVDNVITMTKHVAINAILALGMLLVILKGGIDLSVGSTVGLSGVVAGELLQGLHLGFVDAIAYPQVWAVIVLCIAVGALVGAVNGFLITRLNVAPFIATLGMLYMARATAMLISDGSTYPDLAGDPGTHNTGFDWLGQGRPLGLPVAVWIMIVLAGLVTLLLRKTPFGRWLYATGGNERATQLSGAPVKRVKLTVYVISGACAAMAGLIIASELTSAAPQAGETFELNAIAAVVIGGAALSGGRGNVRGTLVGAFVIGFLADGLVILGVSTFWQMLIKGAVIVVAVVLDQSQQRFQRHRAAASAIAVAGADEAATSDPPARPATPPSDGPAPH